MKNSETKDFVAYEYLSINVKSDKEPLYIDCYENLGWMLVNNNPLVENEDYYINNSYTNNRLINLKFKRDRRIKNKAELQDLQRKLEIALKEVERLEKQPVTSGIVSSLSIGLVGTVFLAISVFAITASNPLYLVCVIAGVIGLIGWLIGFLSYGRVKAKKEKENASLIDEQYNIIYDSQEQAKKLSS